MPHLRKVKGCIINIASLVAELGDYHSVDYTASKVRGLYYRVYCPL